GWAERHGPGSPNRCAGWVSAASMRRTGRQIASSGAVAAPPYWPRGRTGCRDEPDRSAVAQRLDQLLLVHLRPAFAADLGGALAQVRDRPVVVGGRLAAALAYRLAGRVRRRVRDARGLLLRVALVAQRF